MKYTDLSYLTKTNEFESFVKKYNFEKFLYDEKIYLFSNCISIEIFGFDIEKVVYFEVYTDNIKFNTSINVLLSDESEDKIRLIVEAKKISYLKNNKEESESEKNMRQEKEKDFILTFECATILLDDFFKCKNHNKYSNLMQPTFEVSIERVKKAKEEYLRLRKSRFLLDDEIL
ncbi:MAG: hypothetical protein ACTIJ9_11395 [Aequorivita sp.]